MIDRKGCKPIQIVRRYVTGEELNIRMPLEFQQGGKLSEVQLESLRLHNPGHWMFSARPTGFSDRTDPLQWGYTKMDKDENRNLRKFRIVHDIRGRRIPRFLRSHVDNYRNENL